MQKRIRRTQRAKARAKGAVLPHKGRELELMLKGAKPLARFVREPGAADHMATESRFAPHVRSGSVLRFAFQGADSERVYYCPPTEEWRVKLLELVDGALRSGAHAFTIYDLHRIDGALLGYSKADVEFFVARWRRREAAAARKGRRVRPCA